MPKLRENIKERLDNRNLKGSGWSKLTEKRNFEGNGRESPLGPG